MKQKIHENQKTPAFPFYAKDWISDLKVQSLTFEQKGIFLELLCYSWLDDLPNNLEMIAHLSRCDVSAIRTIIDKFFKIDTLKDIVYNERLERIKIELLAHRQQKSNAGKKGNKARWGKQKPKKEVSHSDTFAIRKPIAKVSPPIPIPIPSSIANTSNKEVVASPQISYGNKEINDLLEVLKQRIGVEDFKESKAQQRNHAYNILRLGKKIGKENFTVRLDSILSDDFKFKNSNSLRYLYRELKAYNPAAAQKSIIPSF